MEALVARDRYEKSQHTDTAERRVQKVGGPELDAHHGGDVTLAQQEGDDETANKHYCERLHPDTDYSERGQPYEVAGVEHREGVIDAQRKRGPDHRRGHEPFLSGPG